MFQVYEVVQEAMEEKVKEMVKTEVAAASKVWTSIVETCAFMYKDYSLSRKQGNQLSVT